ncbi:MAG: nucleoid-associated protein [Senegalia sp. (in: firmicutes)]|uniref:nucleoid-associated protein n=1 Tax=Senegalia sp. (in: firmicutes) TaxID=1924098 RepID=UPI003F973C26
MDIKDLEINKMIVHILDNNLEIPVLSEVEHPIDEDIEEFLEKHILKVFTDGSLRPARFNDGENVVKDIIVNYNLHSFVDDTKKLAEILFNIIKVNVDIPPADVIFSVFTYEDRKYFAIFKMNYRNSYIHNVDRQDDKTINSIIKQRTSLPNESQRIDECVLIDLTTLDIKLLEKDYEINGEKIYYLSRIYLKCNSKRSEKEKIKVLNKTTQNFLENNYEGDFEKVGQAKKAVAKSLEENDRIDIESVARDVFKSDIDNKKEYMSIMEKEGLNEGKFEVSEKLKRQNFKKQKIVTDTGIEIKVPIEFFDDKGKIEFVNNTDGTISIVLKQIGNVKNK